MTFADDTTNPELVHWLVSGGAVAIIAGAGLWITKIIKTWNTGRRTARKDTIQELYDLNDKLLLQLDRSDAVMRQSQEALEAVWKSDSDCRVSLGEARTCIRFLYDTIKRLHGTLRGLGHDPGDLPELPPMTEPIQDHHAEYLARQAAQSSQVVQQAGQVLKSQNQNNKNQSPPAPGVPT